MTDEFTAPPEPKRKVRRRKVVRRARPAAPAPAATSEYVGLTFNECCADCEAERCVITRTALCGHPRKGGLQAAMLSQPEILKRYNGAKKMLAHLTVDKRPD